MAFDGRLLSGISVLEAVVESGSFVRAGEALGLTPSGVSRAVARLEARVGVRLFDRTPRAVTLTDEGRRFHARVAPLLSGLEDAAVEIGGSASDVRGRLRVNVDPWIARLVLAPGLCAFLAAHPALSLELVVRDTLGQMVAEGFDVAIRFGEKEDSGLVARKLLETRILTCAAPAYLARHGHPIHPRDLLGHNCLLYRDPATLRAFYPWEFRRGGETIEVEVTGRLLLNDLATKLAACAAGAGVVQSVELGLGPMIARGEVVEILADWSTEYYPLHAYHPSRYLPPAKVRAFLDFVQDSIAAICCHKIGALRRAAPGTNQPETREPSWGTGTA